MEKKVQKAIKTLTNQLNKTYTEEEQEVIEFFIDEHDEHTYTWKFIYNERLHKWIYSFASQSVTKVEKGCN